MVSERGAGEKTVVVFGSSRPRPGELAYEDGVRCGASLAAAGLAVATGGYAGIMEAVSEGAAAAGGHVIGVTAPAIFPDRSGANRFVAEEQPSATLPLRIARLIEISDAAIVLPGSIGTLTELAVAWNTAFVARFSGGEPYPLVAVGSLWRDVVAHLSALLDTDGSVVTFVDDVDEAVAVVTGRLRSG